MSRFRLITGGIGTSKTLWTLDELIKERDKDTERPIYTDIDGVRWNAVQTAPDDWRELPDNSLVVYDEVQYKERFSRYNSKRDQQILDLTKIRKRGIEIWLITQRARFLNADVLGLVNEHVHIEKRSDKSSYVYFWNEAEMNITKLKKQFAFDKYIYTYNEKLFGFYESIKTTAKHHKRSYFNKNVYSVAFTMLIVLIAAFYVIKNYYGHKIEASNGKETAAQHTKASPVATKNQAIPVPGQKQDIDLNQCRSAENMSKPVCVEWLNTLSKTGQSVPSMDNPNSIGAQAVQPVKVDYDPAKPYDTDSAKKQVSYTVVNQPKFSGCMKINGQYKAYTEQGTYLNASKSVCDRLMRDSGSRPYDYFNAHNQSGSIANNAVSNNNVPVSSLPNQQVQESNTLNQADTGFRVIPNNPTFKETDITKPSV